MDIMMLWKEFCEFFFFFSKWREIERVSFYFLFSQAREESSHPKYRGQYNN